MDCEDLPSEGHNLASMETMQPVTSYSFSEDKDMNGRIAGVDASDHMPATSERGEGEEDEDDERGDGDDSVLSRFMRGEISYDDFMRLSGGQTIEEELGGDSLPADNEEEFEEYTSADETMPVAGTSTDGVNATQLMANSKPEFTPSAGSGLPVHVRNLMHEVVSDELAPRRSDAATASPIASGSGNTAAASKPSVMPPPSTPMVDRVPIPRKLSKTMDALLGQANLIYARGNTAEALKMLLEVIRQEPRNAIAYQQVSDIYSELADKEKSLQYGLLAAHLDSHTSSDVWARWGDVSNELNLLEEAAACYGRAIKLEQSNWRHYEKRIAILDRLGLRPLAMRTRLQAAQLIDHGEAGVDFDWFHNLIKTVAQYYIVINDEDRAILALEAFVLRSKEFGRTAESQHETLIGMWMAKGKFIEAGKSIFALCDGITALRKESGTSAAGTEMAMEIRLSNGTYSVEPFPPICAVEFVVEPSFSTIMLTRLIVCFIGVARRDLATPLRDVLLTRDLSVPSDEPFILEIPRAYYNCDAFKSCKVFLEHLREWNNFNENAEMWFIYGNTLTALKDASALDAFDRALQINPSHVDARINLSGLQQRAGECDKALETLQDHDLDTCTHLPDERLLIRQADVLFDGQKKDQFVRCVRMLLTPHFYEIHRQPELIHKRRQAKTIVGLHLSNTLRVAALNAIQNSNWEKFVKRLGVVAANEGRVTDDIDPTLLHDYCLKLIESLMMMNKYQDMLVVCCYAFLQPRINKSDKSTTFQNLLYFCAIKANSWPLAFEYVRWFHSITNTCHVTMLPNNRDVLYKRIFNAMNYVFCHSQNVCYHRFIMRALAKSPGNHALQAISGNNSLITGTYRHALGEYLRVWNQNKKNPLICLLLALTFTHMACKKDLSSRHMIAMRGIGFMKKYERSRTCRQEVFFNIGRMFHQMAINPLAIHFYEKVLAEPPPYVHRVDDDGMEIIELSERYDMRRVAAHNLALIYKTSGNDYLARRVYEQYLVV